MEKNTPNNSGKKELSGKIELIKEIRDYVNKIRLGGEYPLCISDISDVFRLAVLDGTTKLITNESDFQSILHWMISNGQWDWDMKTFMGIELIVKK